MNAGSLNMTTEMQADTSDMVTTKPTSGIHQADLPRAEITPDGDFLIDGKAQPVDAGQRRQLLTYRGQVVGIALAPNLPSFFAAWALAGVAMAGTLYPPAFAALTRFFSAEGSLPCASSSRAWSRWVRAAVSPRVRSRSADHGICRQGS